MQCVLLAAGYATRLYPLTENMPKALLKLGDKTILEMGTDKIDEVSDVENIYIVTKYGIDTENINDEILVMASDNIFDFSLCDFVDMYRSKNADMICAHTIENKEDLHSMGVVELDGDGKVTSFEEKPKQPKSDLGVPPFYLYKRDTLPLIDEYLKEGNNPDAPGHFIPWLIGKNDVYAYVFDAVRIDIGTPESYYDACEKQKNGTLFNK